MNAATMRERVRATGRALLTNGVLFALSGVLSAFSAGNASAHSASDAYLTLDVVPSGGAAASSTILLHGQWDIALRDLDFVLQIDDDGDGNITWAELRRHQPEIARYAFGYLRASTAGKSCAIAPTRQMVDNHADGAYAALFFDVSCPRSSGLSAPIALDYRLFFAIDPSHRGIMVFRAGANTSTSLLAPENARVEFKP